MNYVAKSNSSCGHQCNEELIQFGLDQNEEIQLEQPYFVCVDQNCLQVVIALVFESFITVAAHFNFYWPSIPCFAAASASVLAFGAQ